ncbi:hypothetical protein QN219_08725 [Sinorhizobium sp. 7-81]|uniref:hypothetical protein n=1 Tax=Sinorhizobium sp. 8-89 TaxID=3049089 RepID=UPI0024C20FF4|nr:hypothetical protein [Sinorhizobium sp. 8-89]MDK1490142.1 hypothetical protein [Sinorhizobium sp. 8-89]
MFLDDEIAAARTRRNEVRWGFYLALAALAACIVMILGLMAQASAQTAKAKPQRLVTLLEQQRPNIFEAAVGNRDERAMVVADRVADAPTAHAASLMAEANSQVNLPQTATAADRQILIGLMLLAMALMSGTTFALWRQQIASLVVARVHHHG